MGIVCDASSYGIKWFLYITGFIVAFIFALMTLPVAALYYYLGCIINQPILRIYGWNLAIAIDQLSNTFLLGSTNETISGRVRRALHSGRPKWFVEPFGRFIDRLAVLVANDHNHIEKSEEVINTSDELDSWIRKV